MADLKAPAFDPQKFAKWWMDARLGNDARFPALGLDVGHLVVGYSDDAFALESKMESNGRARMEKSLCSSGLLHGSIPVSYTHLTLPTIYSV